MLVVYCSGNQRGGGVIETDFLAVAPTDADEVNMDAQKCYGVKYTYGPLSSVNPPISVAAPKPLSSNMDSKYIFPTKIPSFLS